MTHTHVQTNGASLEDCHANFFSLTDVCGIKWIVYRESENPTSLDPGQDAVLQSYGRCLEAELLAVWRRVPRRALVASSQFDAGFGTSSSSSNKKEVVNEKNLLSQRKELWIFWYGDKPEASFKKLVSTKLKEVPDISGTWENVLPYEARTLLYKALNNLIERNLFRKGFVRLGKWFVQPFEGPEKPLQKASHLSFSFQYFMHGESCVCASVDVRQHPAVRRLSMHHIQVAKAQSETVNVILAPYGLAATLTGVTYKASSQEKLLSEWSVFYPLEKNKYYSQNNYGDMVTMPAAVEVTVCGARLVFPTCYVLVTDYDVCEANTVMKSMYTCSNVEDAPLMGLDIFHVEPSPFTTSNHPFLAENSPSNNRSNVTASAVGNEAAGGGSFCRQSEYVWQEETYVNPEGTAEQLSNKLSSLALTGTSETAAQGGNKLENALNHWDIGNPGRIVSKRKQRKRNSNYRSRFSSKTPFHKKPGVIDGMSWGDMGPALILDPQHMGAQGTTAMPTQVSQNSNAAEAAANPAVSTPVSGIQHAQHHSNPGSNRFASSPASVGGPVTPALTPRPVGGPGSVPARTPGDPLMSPLGPPMSNGPMTPMETDKNPNTPKSVGPPSCGPPYPGSPFASKNDKLKLEVKNEPTSTSTALNPPSYSAPNAGGVPGNPYSSSGLQESALQSLVVTPGGSCKRPALPYKEYEAELMREGNTLSDSVYDSESMQHWLNHPVKKFRSGHGRDSNEQPYKPFYRRRSQNDLYSNVEVDEAKHPVSLFSTQMKMEIDDDAGNRDDGFDDDKRGDGANKLQEDDNLFTIEGLKPSNQLPDNLFDNSSDESEGNIAGPTPPGSNKSALNNHDHDIQEPNSQTQSNFNTKIKSAKLDPTGNLPHDQLAKMFPTPPSHEPPMASPADGTMDDQVRSDQPLSPTSVMAITDMMIDEGPVDDYSLMVASDKFAPLTKLYSNNEDLPHINVPFRLIHYKPTLRPDFALANNHHDKRFPAAQNPGSNRPGLSPISPLTSVGDNGPRSQQGGPASVGNYRVSSPASVSSTYKSVSAVSAPQSSTSSLKIKTAEANGLVLNLVLSDSLFNVFRDHNFDSCTMCVCSNEGNTRGRDAAKYLPKYSGEDDCPSCICGFSAVINRKLSHLAGLFYEDEAEITSITDDMYARKKASLLLLGGTQLDRNSSEFVEKSMVLDEVDMSLLELIQQQFVYPVSLQSSLSKCSELYLKQVNAKFRNQSSRVEHMDNNYVIYITLDQVKNQIDATTKLDDKQKANCVHKWTLINAPGPYCSEDIIRVMKSLQPVLNQSLHVKKSAVGVKDGFLSVQGPLTWRQFHRMAGTATKGNTDDQCEPLPVPTVSVGHEKDVISLSPLALHFWESLSLEPFSMPRDVAYIVVSPESEFLNAQVRTFFKTLSSTYELCRLGRHAPISKILRDGILQVGKKRAESLASVESDKSDLWFDTLGDSPMASLLRLYSQVCRHYLVPILHNLSLDKTLIETPTPKHSSPTHLPTQSPMPPPSMGNPQPSMSNYLNNDFEKMYGDEGGQNGIVQDSSSDDNEKAPPAIVIYMIDPFSFTAESPDQMRLSSMGLLRCFSQMMPHLASKAQLKDNIYLQLISLESVLELSQIKHQAKMPNVMRGLAFSVYTQAQRTLQYQTDCKTLTGFGPGSSCERFLKNSSEKSTHTRKLYCPPYVLALPSIKKKTLSDSDSFGSSNNHDRNSVLFCNYFLSEDQHWLLASCCDDRGELVKTVVINIEIPNKEKRKKASARRVGLKKLMDWILGILTMSLVSWRLVIGRIGRIGHGELRGWSVLLSRKSLRKASKQLKEMCPWQSDVPSILSACLVSMEPDANLRLFTDQYTPDERFGQTASHCQLSTPKDASSTHILVFPTSAKAQSSQKAFEDHQDGISGNNDLNDFALGIDLDMENQDDDIGDIGDIFNDCWNPTVGGHGIGSPGSPRNQASSQPGSPNGMGGCQDPSTGYDFKYGQEEAGERIEILQQPLALGYLVSTAPTGPMPRWFWSSCPHLEQVCPVFLKSALHINVASVQHGGDDAFGTTQSSSGRLHSLDSTYTADVLRYVLEGYNALSWLSVDSVSRDRKSCLPLHIQLLVQMYNGLASLM